MKSMTAQGLSMPSVVKADAAGEQPGQNWHTPLDLGIILW